MFGPEVDELGVNGNVSPGLSNNLNLVNGCAPGIISPPSSMSDDDTLSEMKKIKKKGSFVRRDSVYDIEKGAAELQGEFEGDTTDLDSKLFDLLCRKDTQRVAVHKFQRALEATGLRQDDPRLKETMRNLAEQQKKSTTKLGDQDMNEMLTLDKEAFAGCIQDNICLISKAFKNEFVIPEWKNFTEEMEKIYVKCKSNKNGKPADYIPQLARFDPNYWGVGICSVDGQRHSIGDTNVQFCLQSASKPLNYAIVLNDLTPEKVHNHVGQEPSGRSFNELSLNHAGKPHNPLINAGAIAVTSLLRTEETPADRFDYVFKRYKELAGNLYLGFSNSTYLSERRTANRNFALAYYMQENKVFPEKANLVDTLEFYFQLCSVEVTAESAAVIASTLANGGICPITGVRVLTAEAVRNTLSLMHSCGMYDYSGQFAFKVGLPAKSGVSGLVMLVVPNVMGIATWSPPLDSLGNSARGLQFCEELVRIFNFHNYDNLKHTPRKKDPRVRGIDIYSTSVVNLLFGAAHGDVSAMRRFALQGMDMGMADYDGRTALHLSCAEGQLDVVRFLLEKCPKIDVEPKDRWGFTPLDDAKRFKHESVVNYLEAQMSGKRVKNLSESSEK